MLWINILSDKLVKENFNQKMNTDSIESDEKFNALKQLDLDVYKTMNYMTNLNKRLKRIEKELDDYFYRFLKSYQKKS